MLSKIELITLAQTAQRLGASRAYAYKAVREHCTRAAWREAWQAAQGLERAFPPLNVSPRIGAGS